MSYATPATWHSSSSGDTGMVSLCQRLLLVCMLLVSWDLGHAYIDPGTGSALIQGLIAAVAAVGVTLKLYWHRIMSFLGLKKHGKDSRSSNGNSDEA